MITRRKFIKQIAASSAVLATSSSFIPTFTQAEENESMRIQDITAETAPVWKGFNLLNKFNPDMQSPFNEKDFEIIAEWGFNFVRIPLSYWCWSQENDWYKIDEKVLKEIDQAVEFGKQYGLHVNLNFHRVPGYCINAPKPESNLFEEEAPLKACLYHWTTFASRYKGIPNKNLSFNLINEAPSIEAESMTKWPVLLLRASVT